jgi:hypothetical protein
MSVVVGATVGDAATVGVAVGVEVVTSDVELGASVRAGAGASHAIIASAMTATATADLMALRRS